MAFLRNLPIKRKLTILMVFVSGITLILACAAFLTYELATFKRKMALDLEIIAQITGANSASSLSFDDAHSAAQTLKSLSAHPHVMAACIYEKAGDVFATFVRAGLKESFPPKATSEDKSLFTKKYLLLMHKIILDGETVGTVFIKCDLQELHERLRGYGLILVLVVIASTLVAFLLSSKLQRIISDPIVGLAQVVNEVAARQDYSVRAPRTSNDELGRLIEGFNEMLNEIQKRDEALRSAHGNLEQRVEERTQELRHENAERTRMESFLNSIVQNLPVAVVIKDARDLRFVLWNKANEGICGITSEEAVGRSDYDFFPKEQADQFVSRDREALLGNTLVENEEEILSRSNGRRILHSRKMSILGDNGQPSYLLGIHEDITERKRAEAELEKIHKQLLDASRQAGMAEVATGVLHNVGNVLNSVNVSATLIAEQIKNSRAANLSRVSALLREHEADVAAFISSDPKGKQLPAYIGQLAEQVSREQIALMKEVADLKKNIEHIKDIVSMQQSYARVSGVSEIVKVIDLVEDALRMNDGALERHKVELVRQYEAQGTEISVDKHKVLQILVNLIRNAKYACADSGRKDKQLTVRVTNGNDRVSIAMVDNGVGIPAENLVRIFNHGFTTRKDGHGFGLHSGALAAKEMGGSLLVRSDGPGTGAEFILELPLKPPQR